jgi:cytochrome c-type biogenesis protein CcmH
VKRLAFLLLGLLALPASALAQDAPAAPAFVIGEPKGVPLSGAALDARTQDVAALLRCPVCQGLSVADSPATMALNMKAQVREMLATGYNQDQILAYFERSYGEFVRLQPPMRGVNWLVWLGPIAALLAGGTVVAWALRRPPPDAARVDAEPASRASTPSDLPSRDALPDDPRLADSVRRVRELAYGWPDGASPKVPTSTS